MCSNWQFQSSSNLIPMGNVSKRGTDALTILISKGLADSKKGRSRTVGEVLRLTYSLHVNGRRMSSHCPAKCT